MEKNKSHAGPDEPPTAAGWKTHETLLNLISLPIFLSFGHKAISMIEDFVASLSDLHHPHDVHYIQRYTGDDPSALCPQTQSMKCLCAKSRKDAPIVGWYDSYPDNEEDDCHQNSIHHVGHGMFVVSQHFEEPPA